MFLLLWGVWYEQPESVWIYLAMTRTIHMSGASVVLIDAPCGLHAVEVDAENRP